MSTIVEVAKQYIGKTEKPNNSGFNDLDFETKMIAVGFKKSQAWCSYFTELVVKEAYANHKELVKDLDKLFSASATQTFNNFKGAGYTISNTPIEGAIVIFQSYKNNKPQWQGHAGIVSKVISDTSFKSIEGNTNDKSGREGYIVAEKTRTTAKKENGLNVIGFIIINQ